MKNILVPTDFSDCAAKAVSAALSLAQNTSSEIHFLHITDIPIDWQTLSNSEQLYPEVNKKIRHTNDALDQLLTKADGMDIVAHKHLVYNKDYRAILDHISELQVELVVMGSSGASGIKEWLVGSNTQKIVRMSPVPVLVIKESNPDPFELNHLVFVSDFNEQVMDQFKYYVEFVQQFDAKLSLLFVNTPENFTDTLTTKIKMGNYAMHAPGSVNNTYVFNHYNFLQGLETFCQEHQVDAIGMITHGGSSGMHLFSNSLTEKVVNRVQTPVLTMHFGKHIND